MRRANRMTSLARQVHDKDLSRISDLSTEWEDEGCTIGMRADSKEDLAACQSPFFLCSVVQDGVVGYARAEISTEHACVFPVGTKYLVLHDLFVQRAYRERVIGSVLMQGLVEGAASHGIHELTTYTANRAWERMVAFYSRFGFRMWNVQMFRSPDDQDR